MPGAGHTRPSGRAMYCNETLGCSIAEIHQAEQYRNENGGKHVLPHLRKQNAMKCSIQGCPGEYEQRKIVHVVHRDEQLMVIDQVPAEVCSICGDVLFTPATVHQLEMLRHTTVAPNRTVPLYSFTETRSA